MTLAEIHEELFEILCLIDDICTREHIRYFLDSGSLIGAVREHDFIPWDDDIDLKVLREDYPAFKAAMLKNMPERFRLIEPEEFAPHFYDFIPRLVDMTKPLRTESEEDRYYGNLQNHRGVDIFIADRAPASHVQQGLLRFRTKLLYGLGMSKRYVIKDEKYTFAQKAAVAVLRVMGKPFSTQWLMRRYDRLVRRWEGTDAPFRYSGSYPLRTLFFFPDRDYQETLRMPMHGRDFPVPAGYDSILTIHYGDYMHPPKDRSIYTVHAEASDAPAEGSK